MFARFATKDRRWTIGVPLPNHLWAGGEPSVDDDALGRAARGAGLIPLFQPVVRLDTREVIGFEALARWPALNGTGPISVFTRAEVLGLRHSLDRACATAAIRAALTTRLGRGPLLLINTEPDRIDGEIADADVLDRGRHELQLVFELTERSLLANPHALLAKVAHLRAAGFAIALDDVGSNPQPLALLDVVAPDIVKLDLGLVQVQPRYEQARTISAVLAHQERSGAVVLAEGIETEDHLEQAAALGATIGQGFLFGGAEALPSSTRATWRVDRHRCARANATANPFDVVARNASVRTARKPILAELSHFIEAQAAQSTDPPIVLTALQHATNWTAPVMRRYHQIARIAPLVAVFAQDIAPDLGMGVRGVRITPNDPLSREWTLVVLGAHTATALIARERGGGDRFDFVLTYDRNVVTTVARNLLDRMT